MKRVCLVTGGTRSGKSRFALERALRYSKRAFIATGLALDDEMRERIARHRAERADAFVTFEEPAELARAIRAIPAGTEVVVVDCLTLWLGNLMRRQAQGFPDCREAREFLDALRNPPCDLVLVTNEVGQGIVPDNALARAFRDAAGLLNQKAAELAQEVVLTVSGIPVTLKGEKP
ncbi:MAG: bifunctional adenosylcobinamide kinase/adenosylcobinamide-phosphate guanylyltransferase [Verrucomicrobiota bacterium]|nr:bifunctional adenosylcobinamide kinase/adenosylcobinamide-phosphate guanylyltransferase [Verrucomicrobiota bacterium]